MLTPRIPAVAPYPNDSTSTAKAAAVDASARAASLARLRDATASETKAADDTAAADAARARATQVPDPMSSLSTVAVAGAMNSLPAALNMMRSIALASAAGTLGEADRQALQSEYAQLTAKVVSTVGGVGEGQPSQASTDQGGARDGNAPSAQETVQYQPVERSTTVQRQTLVEDGHAAQKDPRVELRSHELHVGNDSYEPVAIRQAVEHPDAPATAGRVEFHAETEHSLVVQATQVTQFVQVAQAVQAPPVVAVA